MGKNTTHIADFILAGELEEPPPPPPPTFFPLTPYTHTTTIEKEREIRCCLHNAMQGTMMVMKA